MCWQLDGLALEQLECLFLILVLIIVCAVIDILAFILGHMIDNAGDLARGGDNRFGRAALGCQDRSEKFPNHRSKMSPLRQSKCPLTSFPNTGFRAHLRCERKPVAFRFLELSLEKVYYKTREGQSQSLIKW